MVDAGNLDVLVLALKLFKHVEGGLKAVGDRVRQYISDTYVVVCSNNFASGLTPVRSRCAASIQAEDVREGAKSAIKLIGLFCDLVGLFYSMLTDKVRRAETVLFRCQEKLTSFLRTA